MLAALEQKIRYVHLAVRQVAEATCTSDRELIIDLLRVSLRMPISQRNN
jgi:hypothetical protein